MLSRRRRTTVAGARAFSRHDRATTVLSPWHVRVPSAHIQHPVRTAAERHDRRPRRHAQAHAPPRHPRRARRRRSSPSPATRCPSSTPRGSPPSTRPCARAAASSTSRTWASSWITGDRAVDFVNYVTTNDVAALAIGQVHYSTILNDRGTIEDDCLVYRFADRIMMVVNASATRRRTSRTSRGTRDVRRARSTDVSDDMALLARAGAEGRRRSCSRSRRPISRRSSTTTSPKAQSPACRRSSRRTGYTGEDGFELYSPNDSAVAALGRADGHRRRHPRRTRRARHAAARDGDGALRQRHRRHRRRRSRRISPGS